MNDIQRNGLFVRELEIRNKENWLLVKNHPDTKIPREPWMELQAPRDLSAINEMIADKCCTTVIPDGFLVIDIDVKRDSHAFNDVASLLKTDSSTLLADTGYAVKTINGGFHVYLKYDINQETEGLVDSLKQDFAEGVELKKPRTTVMTPYSLIENRTYVPVSDAPEYTISKASKVHVELLREWGKSYSRGAIKRGFVQYSKEEVERYPIEFRRQYIISLPPVERGKKANCTSFKYAMYACSFMQDETVAFDVLKEWNKKNKEPWNDKQLWTFVKNWRNYATEDSYIPDLEPEAAVWKESAKIKKDEGVYSVNLLKGSPEKTHITVKIEQFLTLNKDFYRFRLNEVSGEVELDKRSVGQAGISGDYIILDNNALSELYLTITDNIGGAIKKSDIEDVVMRIARRNPHNPIKVYLRKEFDEIERFKGARPMGIETIKGFLQKHVVKCNSAAEEAYYSETMVIIMQQLIRTLYSPGQFVYETLPIFYGVEGRGKSLLCRMLGLSTKENKNQFFTDSFKFANDAELKETMQLIRGKLVVEWAELSGLDYNRDEALKAFISKQVLEYRRPFQPKPESYPKSHFLIATTNKDAFVRNPHSARRYYPIYFSSHADIGKNAAEVYQDVLLMYWEAYHYLALGTTHNLSPEALSFKKTITESRAVFKDDICAKVTHFLYYFYAVIQERLSESGESWFCGKCFEAGFECDMLNISIEDLMYSYRVFGDDYKHIPAETMVSKIKRAMESEGYTYEECQYGRKPNLPKEAYPCRDPKRIMRCSTGVFTISKEERLLRLNNYRERNKD